MSYPFGQPATKHCVFVSYHHRNDQGYRNQFEQSFGHIFSSKSVAVGEIRSDLSAEYIKRLIQQDYLGGCSVLVVLCGRDTYGRKHVDWEISGALNSKVNGVSGLLGILLPSHPDYLQQQYLYKNIPARLADNVKSSYDQRQLFLRSGDNWNSRILGYF